MPKQSVSADKTPGRLWVRQSSRSGYAFVLAACLRIDFTCANWTALPAHGEIIRMLPGLNPAEDQVFRLACSQALDIAERDRSHVLPARSVNDLVEVRDGTEMLRGGSLIRNSVVGVLLALIQHGYVESEADNELGAVELFSITPYGCSQYLSATMPNYAQVCDQVLDAIRTTGLYTEEKIIEAVGYPSVIVDCAIDQLVSTGKVRGERMDSSWVVG